MANMEPVLDYEQARKRVVTYFGCEEDFFLKPLLDLEWLVKEDGDFHFLTYWTVKGKKIDAVVVRKNGNPLIYRTPDYTMVVAIDCVKIAFIFQNSKNMTELQA